MPNTSCFLPSQGNTQYKSCCEKQNTTLLQTINIFLKTTSQKNTLQRTIAEQKTKLLTPNYSPITQCRSCMIWSCCWIFRILNYCIICSFFVSICIICSIVPQERWNCYNFNIRCNKSTSPIPEAIQENQKAKKIQVSK